MTLWLVATVLTLAVLTTGALALRAAIRLARLTQQRHGYLVQSAPLAGASAWRTASILMRVMDELEQRVSQDPELTRLRRVRNVCGWTAAVGALPAVYCMVVAFGRLLSE